MSPKLVVIPPEVDQVLRTSAWQGGALRLPPQLDRKLYEATDKVLQALGGKWNRKVGGHVFPGSDEEAMAKLRDALDQGSALDRKATFEVFETPPALAERMAEELDIRPGQIVLEPSAGPSGRLVYAALDAGAGAVCCYEIDEENVAALRQRHPPFHEAREAAVAVHCRDFLTVPPRADFHAVIMNPPFRRNADIRHVRHAWEFVRPGGALAAVMSNHPFFAGEPACLDFRDWLSSVRAEVTPLEEGTFAAEGTRVNTRLVVARKPPEA